jgi:XTP/dITP diphosphohydrolase
VTRVTSALIIATTNEGKAREIRNTLHGVPLRLATLDKAGATKPYREKGRTFNENARGKSLFYSRGTNDLVLAEDSGLEVDALAGAPGVRSARFSAPGANDAKNIRKVLKLLSGVPARQRRARFVCVMALARKGKIITTARGVVRGNIVLEAKGTRGFGYDPIFYYGPCRKTFGELGRSEKNAVSHRGRALRKIRAFLLEDSRRSRPAP